MAQDVKPFKTIEEQIAILEDRGLIIEDEEYAKNSLASLYIFKLVGCIEFRGFRKQCKVQKTDAVNRHDIQIIVSFFEGVEVAGGVTY